MSSTAEAVEIEPAAEGASWDLWGRQIGAILGIEARKSLFGKRAILNYLLAALPVLLLFAMVALPVPAKELSDPAAAKKIFAYMFEGLVLRAVIFFGCAWIFMNLFRGEIVDKSLHYYMLSAVRREVLLVGKYLSGLLAAVILFGGATLVCILLSFLPAGLSTTLFVENGLSRVGGYLLVSVLACVGYGAVFLAIGLFFRNPILPALLVYGWELINFLLPPILKKISIIHYLQTLSPVPTPNSPWAILADPTPAWIAIPGFFVVTALILALSAWRLRHLEIQYGGE